jgi:hypothetical protein
MENLLPAAIGMQMAMLQKNVSLSMIKQQAQTQQQVADILMATISAGGRGQNVNLFA